MEERTAMEEVAIRVRCSVTRDLVRAVFVRETPQGAFRLKEVATGSSVSATVGRTSRMALPGPADSAGSSIR
jgi:hypothetical protein